MALPLAFQHGAGIEVDLILILRGARQELHLIALRPTVVVLHPAAEIDGVRFADACVGQGGGSGGRLADVGAGAAGCSAGDAALPGEIHHLTGAGVMS